MNATPSDTETKQVSTKTELSARLDSLRAMLALNDKQQLAEDQNRFNEIGLWTEFGDFTDTID
jgi:hypothetical protein